MVVGLNTFETFKYDFIIWRFVGVFPTERFRWLYYLYSIFINITVSIFYPLSLIINVFVVDTIKVLLENLTLNITVVVCSMKAFNILFKRRQLIKVKEYTTALDARATCPDEQELLKGVVKRCRQYFLFYSTLYGVVAITGEVSVLFARERRLMYPAWFPFDWRASDANYFTIHSYQFIGICIQIIQNLADDTYPTFYIFVLCGHVKALCMRIKRLGWDPTKTEEQHYDDLVACINDHKLILEYCGVVQNVLSFMMLLQFLTSEIILCLTAVYALFIQDNHLEIIYIATYFAAILMEITLWCYYGNELMTTSDKLTTALYSCNWIDRDQKFKKALIIFMCKTQKNCKISAGNFVAVSLSTFLAIMKTAYSLYAVLHQMKSKNRF